MSSKAIMIMYKGKARTLQELAKLTGISYNTLYRRHRQGTDLLASVERERCTATHSSECLECPYPDCIRTNSQGFLTDERASRWVW